MLNWSRESRVESSRLIIVLDLALRLGLARPSQYAIAADWYLCTGLFTIKSFEENFYFDSIG